MKIKSLALGILIMGFTASSFAINTVQMRENSQDQIDFSDGKPKFKMGTIIQNGKPVEYKKCQYKDPQKPNDLQAEATVPFCQ